MALYKILKYLVALLGTLGMALFVWLAVEGDEVVEASGNLQNSILNPFMYLTYITLIVAIVSVLVFVVVRFFTDNMKETLIALGAFVILFLIAYFIAGSEAITYSNGAHISSEGAKWMNTGFNLLFILVILSVIALVASSLRKLTFRK